MKEARSFYGDLLGLSEGRRSEDKWQDYSLFGHQLVCHFVGDDYRANVSLRLNLSYTMLVSCSMWSGALGSSDVLQSYPITSLASHITIILTMALMWSAALDSSDPLLSHRITSLAQRISSILTSPLFYLFNICIHVFRTTTTLWMEMKFPCHISELY